MAYKDWKSELPEGFSSDSRVWVYQSDRAFTAEEIQQINGLLKEYCSEWISHNRPVRGWASVLLDRFIVFMADDTTDRLCGSAVDNSIRFVKDIEGRYGIRLLDRTLLAFMVDDHIQAMSLKDVQDAVKTGRIGGDTLYFNNTVTTRSGLEDKWIVPLRDSWLGRRLQEKTSA
jgi:hypothetical protein